MRCDAIYIQHILYVYTEDMYINVFIYVYIYKRKSGKSHLPFNSHIQYKNSNIMVSLGYNVHMYVYV